MYHKWYEFNEILSQKILTDSDVQRIVDLCESLIFLSTSAKIIPVPFMNADGFRRLILPIQSEYQTYLDKRKEMQGELNCDFLNEDPPILMGPPNDEIELNLGSDLTFDWRHAGLRHLLDLRN